MASLQVRGGVIVGGNGQVDLVVDVVEHGFDRGPAADQEDVLGVGAAPVLAGTAWAHDDLAAAGDRDAVDDHPVGVRGDAGVGARVPPRDALGQRHASTYVLGWRRASTYVLGLGVQVADRAVQLVEHLGRHALEPVHQLAGAGVGGA